MKFFLLFLLSLNLYAFAPQIDIAGTKFQLNGHGIRTKTFLKVKVYDLALYLTEKSDNAESILNSKNSKYLELSFLRSVDKEKIVGAWKESFEENVADHKSISGEIQKFNDSMVDMKEGDSIKILLMNDRVEVDIKGKKVVISSSRFSKDVLSIWLGQKPVMEELKAQLLGK